MCIQCLNSKIINYNDKSIILINISYSRVTQVVILIIAYLY